MKPGKFALAATAVCSLCLLAPLASNLYADQFQISWSGVFGDGAATVDATDEGSDQFLITLMTDATQSGLTLTLLSPGTYGGNDNFIFPYIGQELDNYGFAFSDGTNSYNIFWGFTAPVGYYECSSAQSDCIGIDSVVGHELSSFSITPSSSVPEPSTGWLILPCSLGLLGLGLRRRPLA